MVVIQLLSCVWLSAPPQAAAHKASLSFTIWQSLLKLMSVELVMPSNLLILLPLLLSSVFPSIRVFSNECKAYQFKTLEYSLNICYYFPLSRWVLLVFRPTAKELSHTYTCILSPPNSPPFQAATQHWAEFPGLYSRTFWLSILNTAVC